MMSSKNLTTEEKIERANTFKDEGNFYLTNHLYSSAALKYSMAIELHPTAIFFSNRAAAFIKLEQYGSAIDDANYSIQLDPSYIKAYYRRASANYALGKLKEAQKDLRTVLRIHPKDPDAQKKLKVCDKAIREEAFNKAIETDAPEEVVLDINAIEVDSSYDGPRLPNDDAKQITLEFIKEVIEYQKNQRLLHKRYVLKILTEAKNVFHSLPTLLRINISQSDEKNSSEEKKEREEGSEVSSEEKKGQIIVCGDTHGQYYDLLNIFELAGLPSPTNPFLFNGDYVDRGSFSFENVFTLILFKIYQQNSIHMLRGNHETKNMNKMYGFEGEVLHKYDHHVFNLFTEVFNNLPLAAVIQNTVFVVHGGLSTQEDGKVSLSDIEAISRNRQPPETGLMSDLLWADPQPGIGRSFSKRGMGYSFGPDFTQRFLTHNNLKLVVRSHEVKDDGYCVDHDGQCITLFSAPNYCDQIGNKGAYLVFREKNDLKPEFVQFSHVKHPNVPPMSYAGNLFNL